MHEQGVYGVIISVYGEIFGYWIWIGGLWRMAFSIEFYILVEA